MKLTKKFNGKIVTIKGNEKCLEPELIIKGIYLHVDRSTSFAFVIGERKLVLSRDEWIMQEE